MTAKPEDENVINILEDNDDSNKNHYLVKVGMIGECQTGKTSLMVKYVEDKFDEEYISTLGVNFMEKTVMLRRLTITISIWDLGGQTEYINLMPLVCNEAKVLLFVFDLTRRKSLSMVRNWYKHARKQNKYAIPFLIGAKFDLYDKKDMKFKEEITAQARKFAKAMHAPLIFCSSSHSINIKKIFQLILAKIFKLRPRVSESKNFSEPIVEYQEIWAKKETETKDSDTKEDS